MSDTRDNEPVIGDDNYYSVLAPTTIDGEQKGFGLVPRDYERFPVGDLPGIRKFDAELIPWQDMPARIAQMEREKSRLSDIRRISGPNGGHIPALDQNGQGFCWAYSPTGAMMLLRAKENQPHARLSAHAIACMIKNFRDQGGWNPQAVEWLIKHGVPTVATWPEKSMSRRNDNATTWAEAANYKVTEGWMDLQASIYDRNLTAQQVLTCLINRIPVPGDHNWWRHSICHMDPLDIYPQKRYDDPLRYGTRFLNSWSDNYGNLGEGVLKDSRWIPDGATALKVAYQS